MQDNRLKLDLKFDQLLKKINKSINFQRNT